MSRSGEARPALRAASAIRRLFSSTFVAAAWTGPVARALTDMGVPDERSEALATLMISTLEGAILMARAERDVRPLTAVTRELGPLLDAVASRTD